MKTYFKDKSDIIIERLEHTNNKYRLHLIQDEISTFIESISIENDKIEFLNILKLTIEDKNNIHKKKCEHENCFLQYKYETALFFINQELDKMDKEKKKYISTYIENFNVMGNGQIFNIGNVSKNIHNNAKTLESQGKDKISITLKKLTEAIKNDVTIDGDEKQLILENLELLSNEAVKDKDKRLSKNVFKNIFSGLNTLSSISTIAGVDFKQLVEYFLN